MLKFQTDCAPNNGYYFIPLMESHGDYVVQIEGPKGWSFEPTQVPFYFDGKTDICSKQTDVNFVFKGFSIFGKVSWFIDDNFKLIKLTFFPGV